MNIYEYVIDANKENQVMADLLNIKEHKTIMLSHNSEFKRISNDKLDLNIVSKFIASNLDIIKKD